MEIPKFMKSGNRAIAPLALLLAGCTATTTEGIATHRCVPTDATFKLKPGQQIYLGDLSSDDGAFNGRHEDWFVVENQSGAINYESGSSLAEGNAQGQSVTRTENGFDYVENGRIYHVEYDNNPHDINAPVEVRVQTDC